MAFKATEKGQALILIAFAAIGLFAFAALAIDGSRAFSDKRHAQNAADTSALAAALSKIRDTTNNRNVWDSAAKTRATSNGYDNNGTTNIVEFFVCGDMGSSCTALPAGAKPEEYVEVKITSYVKTTFARVIGRYEVINAVSAVARAVPGYRTSTFGGQALVALKDECQAFTYGGNGKITVTGSGIFVNSRCVDSANGALDSDSGVTKLTVPCYGVVGNMTLGHPETLINTGGCVSHENDPSLFMSNPLTSFPSPKITCDPNDLGTISSTSTTTTIGPGYYDSRNTGNSFPATGWRSNVVMKPGIYCIDIGTHTFSLSGGQVLSGSNVLIYMKNGGVSWTSGEIHLSAPQGVNENYDGLLLYMAPGNCQEVSITGNGGSSFVGTIMAPCSDVKVAGSSSAGNVGILENQIVAGNLALTGGADLIINFNAKRQWQPPIPPEIQMNQ